MASRLVRGWRRCSPPALFCPARCWSQRPEPEAEPDPDAPIPFRSSKASPRAWSVAQSMGYRRQQQPAWRALLLGFSISALLLWAALREDEAAVVLGPGEAVDGSEGAQPSAEVTAGPGPSA